MITINKGAVELAGAGYTPDGPPMSEQSRDETSGNEAERPMAGERFAALTTAETYIVYDRDDHRAWLESDSALALDAMR